MDPATLWELPDSQLKQIVDTYTLAAFVSELELNWEEFRSSVRNRLPKDPPTLAYAQETRDRAQLLQDCRPAIRAWYRDI